MSDNGTSRTPRVLLNIAVVALWMLSAALLFTLAIRAYRRGDDVWAGLAAASGLLAVAAAQDVK